MRSVVACRGGPFCTAPAAGGNAAPRRYRASVDVFGWFKRHYVAVMRTGGALLVVIGVLLVTGVWDTWVQSMQVWVNGFTVAV